MYWPFPVFTTLPLFTTLKIFVIALRASHHKKMEFVGFEVTLSWTLIFARISPNGGTSRFVAEVAANDSKTPVQMSRKWYLLGTAKRVGNCNIAAVFYSSVGVLQCGVELVGQGMVQRLVSCNRPNDATTLELG